MSLPGRHFYLRYYRFNNMLYVRYKFSIKYL